jgi:hypothetical protein
MANQHDTASACAARGQAPARGAADILCLAAAPTFALMALLTGLAGSASLDMLCATSRHAPLLSGMAPMYWLMTAFHLAPWLRLVNRPLR